MVCSQITGLYKGTDYLDRTTLKQKSDTVIASYVTLGYYPNHDLFLSAYLSLTISRVCFNLIRKKSNYPAKSILKNLQI